MVLIWAGHEPHILRFYLGTDGEAEAVGLTLAAHLLSTEHCLTFPASILANNQAVLKFSESMVLKPGHYLAEHFRRMMTELKRANQRRRYSITIQWSAGHNTVEGDELADKDAKEAVESTQNNSAVNELPQYLASGHLPSSLSAIKQAVKKDTK